MIIQKKIKEIIKKIAKENSISEEDATKIWLSQYELLKSELLKAEFGEEIGPIKFPKWGKFYTSPRKLKYIKSYLEYKNKDNGNNTGT